MDSITQIGSSLGLCKLNWLSGLIKAVVREVRSFQCGLKQRTVKKSIVDISKIFKHLVAVSIFLKDGESDLDEIWGRHRPVIGAPKCISDMLLIFEIIVPQRPLWSKFALFDNLVKSVQLGDGWWNVCVHFQLESRNQRLMYCTFGWSGRLEVR